MQLYVVGVYTNKKEIIGFRVLGLKDDNTTEVKDVSYEAMFNVIKNKKATVSNLEIVDNKLKGVNGSLDRYGIVGKTQAVVIIKVVKDTDNCKCGFLCSDALGQTKLLTEKQVIDFGEKFGIANGKIVPNESGVKHVSSIDGEYKDIVIQKKQSSQQQVSNEQTDCNNIVQKIKQTPAYSKNYIKLIADNIINKVANYNIERQNTELNSLYDKLVNSNLTDDVISTIDELKTYNEYNNSFESKIVNTINATLKCSYKQKACLDKALNKLKQAQQPAQQTQQSQQAQQPAQQTQQSQQAQQAQQPAQQTQQSQQAQQAQQTQQSQQAQQTQQPAQQTQQPAQQTQQPAQQTQQTQQSNNQLKNIEKNKESHNRRINTANKEYREALKKEKVSEQRKLLTSKETRELTQTIKTDGLLDYCIKDNKCVYVEGFNKNATVPEELIIPNTVVLDGIRYKVTGISVGAFRTENIVSLKTHENMQDIGNRAFFSCARLKTVDLSESKHKMISARLFQGCTLLSDLKVGSFVEVVHEYAFSGCISLKNVYLPDICGSILRHAFEWCGDLESVRSNVKIIGEDAFIGCTELNKFNFKNTNSIGAAAFRYTGFDNITLPSNVGTIGRYAFADCKRLQKVVIEEGVREIGEYCFAKPLFERVEDGNPNNVENILLNYVYTPKSLVIIDRDAFRNVGEVYGYTGSIAESVCTAYNVEFVPLDKMSLDNSTKVRIKSTMIGLNPIEQLKRELDNNIEGASNPDMDIINKQLVEIPLSEEQLRFFNIKKSNGYIKPHIKFNAIVNYLQDVSRIYKLPLTNKILRMQEAFYVNTDFIYNDGCNIVAKITYQIMDSLDEGSFIIVIENNVLRYVADCTLYTNIKVDKNLDTDLVIPIEKYLHSGDIIGDRSTISGRDGIIDDGINIDNVGCRFYNRIHKNGIIINTKKTHDYIYVPCANIVLSLEDKVANEYDGESYDKNNKLVIKSVLKILKYDEFIKELKNIKKNNISSDKFFKEIESYSANKVKRLITNITTVYDEKEAQLFRISKQFNKIVDNRGIKPNPELLTYDIFNELSKSYWIVEKDENWLRQTGRKSLNEVISYNIGKYKLTEYVSNQIVKFNNPYMNGCKGAYVFTLTSGSTLVGVYASRYTMQTIVEMLYDLTNLPKNAEVVDLMQSAENFDIVNPKLFYHFFDVLKSKNGWQLSSLSDRIYSNYSVAFGISMYKPTGIFYLTITKITVSNDKNISYSTIPILPIGNMDRALIVASTTNKNVKNTRIYEELMELSCTLYMSDRTLRIYSDKFKSVIEKTYNNYVEARKLILNKDKDINKYRELIDDRAVFMLGTIHSGIIQRDISCINYDDDFDIEDDTYYNDEIELDLDENDDEDDLELDAIDIESEDYSFDDETDDEDDLELDDEDRKSISFDEFFETAKSMGITDITQVKAMYINFINNK